MASIVMPRKVHALSTENGKWMEDNDTNQETIHLYGNIQNWQRKMIFKKFQGEDKLEGHRYNILMENLEYCKILKKIIKLKRSNRVSYFNNNFETITSK